MLFLKFLLVLCSTTILGATTYEPNWDSLDSRPVPEWFDKAKIGIFIHWGVFSVPSMGTEWFYAFMNDGGEVSDYVQNYFPPNFSYQEFAKSFTAEFFDAAEWAELFSKAGAKYVVLTSKHHEGFTMWPSQYSYSWNSKDIGPHRDIVGELGEAVRAANMTYGLYHSLMEWYHPLYLKTKGDWSDRSFPETKAIPELYELVNTYQPSLIWSDGDWEAPETYWNSTGFLAWLYNESPVKDFVAVNDRWGSGTPCNHGGYLTCHDRYLPDTLQSRKWENAMSLDRTSYGFRRNAKYDDYLTIDELISTLIQTIAYGGNLLINIGPGGDGTINMIFQERLLQMGSWLSINGEAIYESTPWTSQVDSLNSNVYYTTKNAVIYALFATWPSGDHLNVLQLGSLSSSSVANMTLLGYGGDVEWTVKDDVVEVTLPDLADVGGTSGWVLKIVV